MNKYVNDNSTNREKLFFFQNKILRNVLYMMKDWGADLKRHVKI